MPPKRPSPSQGKRQPERLKVVKVDNQPPDFSTAVRKRIQGSSRTGQACDRCRVRKMKCDSRPGGCGPCAASNSACVTTDRITGKANTRGYVEQLEHDNQQMRAIIDALHARLRELGVDLPYNAPPPVVNNLHDPNQPFTQAPPTVYAQHLAAQEPNLFTFVQNVPDLAPAGLFGLTFCPLRGTKLKVLGLEIDIADFSSPDVDEPSEEMFEMGPIYNKSCTSMARTISGKQSPILKVSLPLRDRGFKIAEWYFKIVNPFLPILHKPTFYALLIRFYDEDDFKPSPAETVIVHMVFAVMRFQLSTRNREDVKATQEANQTSNDHYHYCLRFLSELMIKPALEDIQALALICSHLRSFPGPGAFSIISNVTFNLAIDLGMHRSLERIGQTDAYDPLETEMRKRVFWSLLSTLVTIGGRLGRPLPIQMDEFDVEIPEAIADECITKDGIDRSQQVRCLHQPGIELFKCVSLRMDVYKLIRKPGSIPIEVIYRLEQRINQWAAQCPDYLKPGPGKVREDQIMTIYLDLVVDEMKLLLHHPSLVYRHSADLDEPAISANNMEVCLQISRKMLANVGILRNFKSLDPTWYNCAVYILAIVTRLYIEEQRKDQLNSGDLEVLRSEMNQWESIMGDLGDLFGSGKRLQTAITDLVDTKFQQLEGHLASKTAASALSSANQGVIENAIRPAASVNGQQFSSGHPYEPMTYHEPTGSTGNQAPMHESISDSTPNLPNFSYPEPSHPMTYTTAASYGVSPYAAISDQIIAAAEVVAPSAGPGQSQHYMLSPTASPGMPYMRAPQPMQGVSTPGPNASMSWHNFTQTMTGQQQESAPQQDFHSANVLIQLRGRESGSDDIPVADMKRAAYDNLGDQNVQEAPKPGSWPETIFGEKDTSKVQDAGQTRSE